MKKIFKSRMFAFILGAVIFGGIVGVSAYTILANDVGYTPKDTTWKKSNGEDITNVKDAIDELYIKKQLSSVSLAGKESITGNTTMTYTFQEDIEFLLTTVAAKIQHPEGCFSRSVTVGLKRERKSAVNYA